MADPAPADGAAPGRSALWVRLGGRTRVREVLRGSSEVVAVLGGAAAVWAVGFEHGAARLALLTGALQAAAGLLAALWTAWLLTARDRRAALRSHRGTALGVLGLVAAVGGSVAGGAAGRAGLEAAVLVAAGSVAVRHAYRLTRLRTRPEVAVLVLFAALVGVGMGALMLPRATTAPGAMPWLDALFTAASAVCVTGLVVVPTGEAFTPLGQGILLGLIQVGALGIVSTITAGTVLFGAGGGVGTQALLRDIWDTRATREARRLVGQIVALALVIEALGFVGFFFTADLGAVAGRGAVSVGEQAYFALFHAISAFCNAGFSTLPTSFTDPALANDLGFTLVAMTLIVVGGLGFVVTRESLWRLAERVRPSASRKPGLQEYGVQVRLVWVMTGLLLVGGALALFAALRAGALAGAPLRQAWLAATFQSVTARTAGFNTLEIGALGGGAAAVLMLLMLVGASPGSTGGGLRTTTVAVLGLFTAAMLQGRARVDVFGRTLTDATVRRAVAVLVVALAVVVASTLALVASEGVGRGGPPLLDVAFEAVSAFATVGLSRGITADLSAVGKAVVIVTMFAGRVGMVALVVRLARTRHTPPYRYPEDSVMVV